MQSLSSLFSHSPSSNTTCSSSPEKAAENNNSAGRLLLQDAFIKDDADQLVSSINQQQHCNDDDINIEIEDEFEFEFALASVLSPVPADQIFYNGQIRPLYPHFKAENNNNNNAVSRMTPSAPLRKLFVEERELDTSASSCSSSVTDELEAGTYCIWDSKTADDDSREFCNKSSNFRRWKLRDFLQKSNSCGKNSFAILKYSH